MIDRRPALIASCLGVADVVTCVNFAREHGVTLSIKGGCHNISMQCTPAFPQQKTLQEREAGIHAAALREKEIGKLIERLSSECEKLSAELCAKELIISRLKDTTRYSFINGTRAWGKIPRVMQVGRLLFGQ